ncbi:YciI family protein [Phenylobacterium sp.]|uniref:YciI family protein n=1 Tax=Phenylobacterium sp. TaxID=1871053 RepID=UPI0027380367|nr:YciI family protein [Phenylobacterium sp.]MDP3870671.1 YciI family protein [Phenylobacterium sp.]
MRFMITFNHVEGVWDGLTDAERAHHGGQIREFMGELTSAGSEMVFFAPKRRTVRQHADGRVETLDGPCSAGPEQPGGYFIIEAADWAAAEDWARRGRFITGSNQIFQLATFPGA